MHPLQAWEKDQDRRKSEAEEVMRLRLELQEANKTIGALNAEISVLKDQLNFWTTNVRGD